jgi:hypothetical protein
MSTRSTTNFGYGMPDGKPDAKVYRHPDGYPEAMLPDILTFFETVEAETNDPRYTHPSYLAAKWVVFLARMFSRKFCKLPNGEYGYDESNVGSLDFISVGVVDRDPGDIEYTYWLDSGNLDPETGRPGVYMAETPFDYEEKGLTLEWRPVTVEEMGKAGMTP